MSATKTAIPLDVARRAAERLVTTLAPACARIEIAGSIRRGKPEVGDIELVAIPSVMETTQLDLFGEVRAVQKRNLLDEELERLIEMRAIRRTPPSPDARAAWGEHYKKLWLAAGGQVVQVDLFLAQEENWGAIYCIRTGPAAFSQALVTHFKLHTPYRQQDGALVVEATGELVPVPEEADYFRLAGVPYIEPGGRSAGRLHRLLSRSRPSTPTPAVVNIRDLPSGWQRDPRYVYIGRRNSRYGVVDSKWLNPFVVGQDGDRATVIRLYREYLAERADLLADLDVLRGKTMVCWCAPEACHGDVLRELLATGTQRESQSRRVNETNQEDGQ